METYLYQDLYNLEDKHWWHIAKRRACQNLLATLKSTSLKILDLGCGAGKNVETFSAYGSTYGIDLSTEAIRFCHKRGLKNVSRQNLYRTTFYKNSFDLITALDVIEHVDDHKAMREVSRILKPNGHIIIHVPAYSFLWSRWDEVLHHKRRYTQASLRQLLQEEGFTIKKITYLYSFLLLPAFIIRRLKSWLMPQSYGSDFSLSNPLLNKFFLWLATLEQKYAVNHTIPFGTSIMCLAQKKS